jgi:hypothetical protein
MIHIMPINFIMGTWLVKFKVGGGGLRWTEAIVLSMKPTSPTFFFSSLLNKI